uniref:Uncharacterized protein n=1 Tax=Picea glauca TaxID=3330 RepID=A0A117NJ92_PICGL|nr:hypothetical protein ABT39_MTgene1046 [Picea glauca]
MGIEPMSTLGGRSTYGLLFAYIDLRENLGRDNLCRYHLTNSFSCSSKALPPKHKNSQFTLEIIVPGRIRSKCTHDITYWFYSIYTKYSLQAPNLRLEWVSLCTPLLLNRTCLSPS